MQELRNKYTFDLKQVEKKQENVINDLKDVKKQHPDLLI